MTPAEQLADEMQQDAFNIARAWLEMFEMQDDGPAFTREADATELTRRLVHAARHVVELEAAVDRIREFHDQEQYGLLAPGLWCPGCGEEIPCRTIRALNGRPTR